MCQHRTTYPKYKFSTGKALVGPSDRRDNEAYLIFTAGDDLRTVEADAEDTPIVPSTEISQQASSLAIPYLNTMKSLSR